MTMLIAFQRLVGFAILALLLVATGVGMGGWHG